MAASSSTCPSLPTSFYQDFGISQQVFHSAFDYVGNGVFKLKPGWLLPFTRAVLTTGDRATTVTTPAQSGSAGRLWTKCTGQSVMKEKCCVHNCPNQIAIQAVVKTRAQQRMSTPRLRRLSMISIL